MRARAKAGAIGKGKGNEVELVARKLMLSTLASFGYAVRNKANKLTISLNSVFCTHTASSVRMGLCVSGEHICVALWMF